MTEAWPDGFFVFKTLFLNLIVVLYIQSLEDQLLKASEKAKTKTRTTATRLQETPEKG